MRMLAATLWRHIGNGPLENLQQGLLYALARDIARNRRILVLAADLIDFVNIDDARLAPLHIPIGVLQQPQDDVLYIFADVARFGERGRINDRERHVQNPCKRLSQ